MDESGPGDGRGTGLCTRAPGRHGRVCGRERLQVYTVGPREGVVETDHVGGGVGGEGGLVPNVSGSPTALLIYNPRTNDPHRIGGLVTGTSSPWVVPVRPNPKSSTEWSRGGVGCRGPDKGTSEGSRGTDQKTGLGNRHWGREADVETRRRVGVRDYPRGTETRTSEVLTGCVTENRDPRDSGGEGGRWETSVRRPHPVGPRPATFLLVHGNASPLVCVNTTKREPRTPPVTPSCTPVWSGAGGSRPPSRVTVHFGTTGRYTWGVEPTYVLHQRVNVHPVPPSPRRGMGLCPG